MTALPPALVLNADFRPLSHFPLSLLDWHRTIRAVFKDKVVVVAEYDRTVGNETFQIRLPSVVALRAYVHMPRHVAFTRFNVFLRDLFTCQFCGEEFASKHLTFDHVVPRARGGTTSWENVVAACEPCNTRKGHDIEMRPVRMPHEPTAHQLAMAARKFPPNHLHESWTDFLYWDAELEH